MQSTVICATSSYALLLAEKVGELGLRDKIALRHGVIGSERWGEKTRQRIKDGLGIDLFDIYGLTEVYGPGIGINCRYETGMKNKMQMLCFIISKPPVILLDEPLTSLDVVVALEIKKLLREMRQDHIILFSTHILQLATDLCDEIVLLNDGKLEQVDHSIIGDPQFEERIVSLLKDVNEACSMFSPSSTSSATHSAVVPSPGGCGQSSRSSPSSAFSRMSSCAPAPISSIARSRTSTSPSASISSRTMASAPSVAHPLTATSSSARSATRRSATSAPRAIVPSTPTGRSAPTAGPASSSPCPTVSNWPSVFAGGLLLEEPVHVAASYLACHPRVRAVAYPGLSTSEDHQVAATSLVSGFGPYVDYATSAEGMCWHRIDASGQEGIPLVERLERELAR